MKKSKIDLVRFFTLFPLLISFIFVLAVIGGVFVFIFQKPAEALWLAAYVAGLFGIVYIGSFLLTNKYTEKFSKVIFGILVVISVVSFCSKKPNKSIDFGCIPTRYVDC